MGLNARGHFKNYIDLIEIKILEILDLKYADFSLLNYKDCDRNLLKLYARSNW